MSARAPVLGIDFGTSNSAAGFLVNGSPQLVRFDDGQKTLPSTFFFDFDTREMLIGDQANTALLDGAEGRFMRALKRILGTPLMHEERQILNERVTFVEIVARFLRHLKEQSERECGVEIKRVLSGRPVVFHGVGDPREGKAEADLRACYLAAGFTDVAFMYEPQAAAIASGALEEPGLTGLIVDIGGGTSDFSIFRTSNTGVTILANHGVRVGGTDFDRSISIDRVMPLLGKGAALRKTMGSGTVIAPNAIFNDLATWEKIPFLYSAKNLRMAREMERVAEDPGKLSRLVTTLRDEVGHDLAFAVERGKISVNSGDVDPRIELTQVERGLTVPLTEQTLAECLHHHKAALAAGAQDVVQMAGLTAADIQKVIYVGGSSLMALVPSAMKALFPKATHSFSEVFTAVADGLAIAAAKA